MSVYTCICRTCGGTVDLEENQNHRECPACGTENCRPQSQGETLDRLHRANRLRRDGEYADALRCYQYVLMDYENEHEALWGKLQCQYGVEFVTDPRTGERYAVVHEPHISPMQLQSDFKRACELAPPEVRAQYEAEAAYVDEALAEINRHKENSPHYDVFICHKTTPLTGAGYTEDYNRGVLLERWLTQKGYRVFFAPLANLEKGANYEAGIYFALWSAKVMLLISSDETLLNSPWVKSEWSRYLEMIDRRDMTGSKRLIPLMYAGFQENRMPKEIRVRKLQSIHMEDPDAMEELDKLLRKAVGTREARKTPPAPVDPAPKHYITEAAADGVRITGYKGPGGKVRIPAKLDGQPVVEIGTTAFEDCDSLTEVALPEGLLRIGNAAFNACSKLAKVNIPASVTEIVGNPFSCCRSLRQITVAAGNQQYFTRDTVLMSRQGVLVSYPAGLSAPAYKIPENVKSIGECAFRGALLANVTIPANVTKIGAGAFWNCTGLTGIVLPEGVKTIEKCAFLNCESLRKVHLPQSLTEIQDNAFEGCHALRGIALPEQISLVGRGAFRNCHKALMARVHEGSAAHAWAQREKVRFELIKACAPEADFVFKDEMDGVVITGYNGNGGEVIVPAAIGGRPVVALGYKAFIGSEQITAMILPQGLKRIDSWAFEDCVNLERVSIPEGVTHIGDFVFDACESLREIHIPASVTEIGHNPVESCTALQTIRVAAGNQAYYVKDNALTSRDGHLVGYAAACTAETYTVPENVTTIGYWAFGHCAHLRHVTIPASVTSIGDNAFDDSPVTLHVHQGSAAHSYAQEKQISFRLIDDSDDTHHTAADVTCTLCGHTFTPPAGTARCNCPQCGMTNEVRRGKGGLGDYAPESHFQTQAANGGVSITKYTGPGGEVKIPPTIGGQPVVGIERKAFEKQRQLLRVTIPDTVRAIEGWAFQDCSMMEQVIIPAGVTRIGSYAFDHCAKLREIQLPASLEKIGINPFESCTALQTIHVDAGNRAYDVRDNALLSRAGHLVAYAAGCTAEAYTVPEGVKTIGHWAFGHCAHLRNITIPASVERIEEDAFTGSSLTFHIHPDSAAHAWAQKKGVRFELIGGSLDGVTCTLCGHTFTPPSGVTRCNCPQCGMTNEVRRGGGHSDDYAPESHFQTQAASGGVSITKYTGPGGTVKIPPTIGGRPVVEIAKDAFKANAALTRLELPEGVVKVEFGAFFKCPQLTEVRLPASLAELVDNPFMGCAALRTITIAPGRSRFTVRDNVVFSDDGTLVCYPGGLTQTAYEIPQGVTCIGGKAFCANTHLTAVTIPASVTWIRYDAFHSCERLKQVTIPEGVKKIDITAFGCCRQLERATLPASLTEMDDIAFWSDDNVTLYVPANSYAHTWAQRQGHRFEILGGSAAGTITCRLCGHTFTPSAGDTRYICPICSMDNSGAVPEPHGDYAPEGHFQTQTANGGVSITKYTGPGGRVKIPPTIGGKPVVEIGKEAFERCAQLTQVTIPDSVRCLRSWAFNSCARLTDVRLPQRLEEIESNAFHSCEALRSVSIPASVRSIGHNPFANCSALESLTVAAENPVYYVRDQVLFSRDGKLLCCLPGRKGSTYTVPEGVRIIGWNAFAHCNHLTQVILPQSLTELEANAFNKFQTLAELTLPEGLTTIDDWAFDGCRALTTLTIPASVTKISNGAFVGCNHVKLRVHANSAAHQAAQKAGMQFELIGKSTPGGTITCRLCSHVFTPRPGDPKRICPVCSWENTGSSTTTGGDTSGGAVTPAGSPESHFEAFIKPDRSGCSIQRYVGPGGDVVIPETIQGIPVVGVWETAFNDGQGVRTIQLPRSLMFWGAKLFRNLRNVTLKVPKDSNAHIQAQSNGLRFEVIP